MMGLEGIHGSGASRFGHLMSNMDKEADRFASNISPNYDLQGQIKNLQFEMQHVMDDFGRLRKNLYKLS